MTLFELWFSQGICPVVGLLGRMVVLFVVSGVTEQWKDGCTDGGKETEAQMSLWMVGRWIRWMGDGSADERRFLSIKCSPVTSGHWASSWFYLRDLQRQPLLGALLLLLNPFTLDLFSLLIHLPQYRQARDKECLKSSPHSACQAACLGKSFIHQQEEASFSLHTMCSSQPSL